MKGKILVVEDLPSTSQAIQLSLIEHGYDVVAAYTRVQALQRVYQERFHLAMLDVSLAPNDANDTQGLDLMWQIKAFDPTIVIVINTKYATVDKVRVAMQPDTDGVRPAFNVLVKSNLQELDQEISKAFKVEVKINLDLTINTSDGPSVEQLTEGLARKRQKLGGKVEERLVTDEFSELLQRLFHNASSVDLAAMSQGYSGAGVVRAIPHYLARGKGQGQPLVVKFGENEEIERETNNFYDFVNGVIGGDTYPMIQGIRRTRNLAGILYSLIGRGAQSKIEDFNTLYFDNNSLRINGIVTQLFQETCGPWYSTKRGVVQDLAEYYTRSLHLSTEKLTGALQYYFPTFFRRSEIQFEGLAHRFVNPVYYLSGKTFQLETVFCTTHGDLNGRNILIDQREQTWLIDFMHTGGGHAFRDFIKLETVIKFELLQIASLETRYAFEALLLDVKTFESGFEPGNLDWDQELVKAATVIIHLRRLACQIIQKADLGVDYFVGLLFHTVNYIKFLDVPKVGRQHALMAAGMLCSFLDKSRVGSSEGSPYARSGLGGMVEWGQPGSHVGTDTKAQDSRKLKVEAIKTRAQAVESIIVDLEQMWRSGDIDTAQYSRLAASRREQKYALLSEMRTLMTSANADDPNPAPAQYE